MGRYETAYWESDAGAPSDAGTPTRRDCLSGIYHPYAPDLLADGVNLSMEAAAACEAAAVSITRLEANSRYSSTAESLSRILLRSEAISSSRIEGLEMNARRLLELEALDELGVAHRLDSVEAEVLGNIRAMHEAIDRASKVSQLTVSTLCAIHRELLSGTRLKEYGGVVRTTQNWVGGSWYNPLLAAFVPPRPEQLEPLLNDLVAFANTTKLPAIAAAAIVHAQFETIHPFADGNGRTGRALVHVMLRRSGLCERSIVPVSLVLNTLKDQYVSALARYRFDADESGCSVRFDSAASEWVEFFCHATRSACVQALAFEERVAGLRQTWQEAVRPRQGSATQLLLEALPGNPVVSIASVKRIIGRSYPAARGAVRDLEQHGVLTQSSKNRKSGLYRADEALDLFTSFERSLATPSGDTRLERPARPVPQRPR